MALSLSISSFNRAISASWLDVLVLGVEGCCLVGLRGLFAGLVVGRLFDRSSAARIPDTLRAVFAVSGSRGRLLPELSEMRTRGGSDMSAGTIAVTSAGDDSCLCCTLSAVSRVLKRNMPRRTVVGKESPVRMPKQSGVYLQRRSGYIMPLLR
jgi:hypothetical protein